MQSTKKVSAFHLDTVGQQIGNGSVRHGMADVLIGGYWMFRFMVTEFIADLPKWNDSSQMNLSKMMPKKGQESRVITVLVRY